MNTSLYIVQNWTLHRQVCLCHTQIKKRTDLLCHITNECALLLLLLTEAVQAVACNLRFDTQAY